MVSDVNGERDDMRRRHHGGIRRLPRLVQNHEILSKK